MIDDAQVATTAALPAWRTPLRRFRFPFVTWIGVAMLAAVLFAAAFAPLLTHYDPIKTDLPNSLQPPSAAHPLGTDNFGRDILTRLLHGARVDLQIGIVPTAATFLLGLVIGSVAGYYGGAVDGVLMRIVDVSMAFPFYVLVIAIVAMLGPGLRNMYVAMVLAGWDLRAGDSGRDPRGEEPRVYPRGSGARCLRSARD